MEDLGGDAQQGKRRDGAATRARLLQAAMREFASKGLEARVEDIAEIAGTNRRMAYYYFGSKEGLYLAALEATYLELVMVEKTIDVDSLDPVEAIATLVMMKFEHYVRYPHYVEFLKIENLYHARHLKTSDRLKELRGPLLSIVRKVLERGRAIGVFRAGVDPVELYVSICALGFFVFSNQYTLGTIFGVDLSSRAALEKRRAIIVDMVIAYLAPPSGPAKSSVPALSTKKKRNRVAHRVPGKKGESARRPKVSSF